MKLIQKHIIVLSGFAIFILFGYSALQKFNSPQSGEMKTDIKPISIISQSGIETDSIKRLKTYSESGTAWNMSPFGSGKPLEEEKKPVFKKPNTEWKTRTLSGITYVFGEGNPKEVALTVSRIQQEFRECEITPGSLSRMCHEGKYGYISPEIEHALKKILESPLWEDYVTHCSSEYLDNPRFTQNILNQDKFDINHLMILDTSTGRKELELHSLSDALRSAIQDDSLYSGFRPCAEKHGGMALSQMLSNIQAMYTTTASIANQTNQMPSHSEITTTLNH